MTSIGRHQTRKLMFYSIRLHLKKAIKERKRLWHRTEARLDAFITEVTSWIWNDETIESSRLFNDREATSNWKLKQQMSVTAKSRLYPSFLCSHSVISKFVALHYETTFICCSLCVSIPKTEEGCESPQKKRRRKVFTPSARLEMLEETNWRQRRH